MSFDSSLRYGALGETLFYVAHEGTLEKLDGRTHDFRDLRTGGTIELKTDFYSMEKTPNFFFERFSDRDKEKPGGPWQAAVNGTDTFIYFYVNNLRYFTFDISRLVAALDDLIPTLIPTEVPNKNYVTVGYRIPREILRSYFTEGRIDLKAIHNDETNE